MPERSFCQNPSPALMAILMTPCGIGMLALAAGAAKDYAIVGLLFGLLGLGLILAAPYTFFVQRRYSIADDHLIARNKLGEIRVPLTDVKEIRIPEALVQRRGGVTLVFQTRTKLGKQLRILPLYWVSTDEASDKSVPEILNLMATPLADRT